MACACGNKNKTTQKNTGTYAVVSQSGTTRTFRKREDAEQYAQRTGGKVKTG